MKKAAAHPAVVTSNWKTAQIALTVAKIPRYDLAEEQYWYLRALWLALLTLKMKSRKKPNCEAELKAHNIMSLHYDQNRLGILDADL